MKLKKILIISGVVVAAVAITTFTVVRAQSGYTKVLTAKVVREDLTSIVSGTGQIKPKTYVNIGATSFGRITHLYVKEGDRVKKGQELATVESVQAQAGVVALYKEALIAKSEYDSKKAAYDTAVATLAQSKAALVQSRAQTASAKGKLGTAVATLTSDKDLLNKTVSVAPFDGIVTNMPVREGETVVVGIQNAQGSTLMTLADLSVITAEVKVDETDIVNVSMNQPVDVTVDALPGKTFKGIVTEVGDQAILRSTGIATSQSTTGTEEAKDFKVVVTLINPPAEMRPGLSATAKITTAKRQNVLAIPIQALAMRTAASLKQSSTTQTVSAASTDGTPAAPADPGTQGVFVMRNRGGKLKSEFVPVTTGITGSTDIEVTSGLSAGDEIVIGPYKVLRTLKNDVKLKRDNAAATTETEAS
jgi:HlyD family secretion protein